MATSVRNEGDWWQRCVNSCLLDVDQSGVKSFVCGTAYCFHFVRKIVNYFRYKDHKSASKHMCHTFCEYIILVFIYTETY